MKESVDLEVTRCRDTRESKGEMLAVDCTGSGISRSRVSKAYMPQRTRERRRELILSSSIVRKVQCAWDIHHIRVSLMDVMDVQCSSSHYAMKNMVEK